VGGVGGFCSGFFVDVVLIFFILRKKNIVCPMEEEGRCLVETFEDKQKELKGVREFIRLPIMYHPDSTWRHGCDGLYYRSSMFREYADLSGQPPRDISALKIDATVEEHMLVHEVNGIGHTFQMLQKVMPPMSLGKPAVAVSASVHTLKRKSDLDRVEQKRARK
jgi:hypothetical protein